MQKTATNPSGSEPMPLDRFDYKPQHSQYDEVLGANGEIREHWHYPMQVLRSMGPEALLERQRTAKRILRDDGASYSPGDQLNISHTWNLDLLPLILSSQEWEVIENALRERAELLNLILDDLYGERNLIKHRVIPPAAVYGHPGFLRACDGIRVPGQHQLIFHASDLVRNQQGEWLVIGDRTQAPTGTGYALENRTVLRRVMPSLFRDTHVHRLSNFFLAWRRKMAELSQSKDSPLVVYLTQGAFKENSFEDAYLANYLGYPLVQARDLTVRKGSVWLKSLDGLRRVDVVLRRVDDEYTDPLVSRYDSSQGVPGLLEVARSGGVVIANPLGSGVLENPVLAKYMPAIAQHFLGRELRLNSVQTWWCGDANDLEYVKAHFDELLIRPTYRLPGKHSIFVSDLPPQKRQQLLAEILAKPRDYVAQVAVSPSHTPVLSGASFSSRPLVMRGFTVASGSSYNVMPGGLTRVGSRQDTLHIVSQYAGASKDTWILESEPEVPEAQPDDFMARQKMERSFSLPSRVIENLYWFGRYAERAESGLRLVRTAFEELNSIEPLAEHLRRVLLEAVTHLTATYPGFTAEDADFSAPEQELLDLVANRARQGSIAHCLESILHSAGSVKELLSNDMLRLINDVRDGMEYLNTNLASSLQAAPEELLDPLITTLLALSGLSQESMVRGRAWRFMEIGRRIERAQRTVELLRHTLVTGAEGNSVPLLKPVLASLESRIVYKRYYRTGYRLDKGLELLLFDPQNPRSVLFQLEALKDHLEDVSGPIRGVQVTDDMRCVLRAVNSLLLSSLAELSKLNEEGTEFPTLDELLASLEDDLNNAAQFLADRYFDHTSGPQPIEMSGRGLQ
ncbi:circularly permuted type 2 ATP-grasp protein [Spongiibacter taiwanensis]|uniref:circularly permuted type 2 ATP-grasp protein n=1 Tax=Spongiibacter taiwanensis TaxID=1748242 RepID=UPI002035600C|nr:circularly permuted type 2 ATP-grasp protein [Spongiibacter taiwanensis]USA44068.1 circularly permuted type 2 ATP-grasp protein [Spongiibacter taiwanensis]